MGILAVLIPTLCFVVLLRKDKPRESFLVAAIANGLFIAISTEILSLFEAVEYLPLLVCWSMYLMALLIWRYRSKATSRASAPLKLTVVQKILLAMLLCVIAIAGVTALVSAPNNWDSLTYHLPRVLHWIQNESVRHYPTHIDRQLVLAPWSEFAIMHLQLLSGGDRFANCVQWFSLVGSALGVSLVASALQGSLNSQIIAAVISVSVPMGLLQATSSQNDYAAAFWLVCLTYFVVQARECPDLRNALLTGASLALAIFTKGTAYLVAAPFMLLYMLFVFQKTGSARPVATGILVVAALILIVNGGHYTRNFRIYGNPITPGTGNDIVCNVVGLRPTISCVSRNIATQLATGSNGVNTSLMALCRTIHDVIGVDVNDSRLISEDTFVLIKARNNEDLAPNPVHMAILVLSAMTVICFRKNYSRPLKLCCLAGMLSFILLSMGVQWNLFVSRYFLPVLVISAPFVSLLYDGSSSRHFANALAVGLLCLSITVLATNETRPLVGDSSVFVTSRLDQYFVHNQRAKPYFNSVAGMVKAGQVNNVGIVDRDGNMWEYLLWLLLQDGAVKYRIEHVGVENASGKIKLRDFSTYVPVMI